jgi:hypothetical protein
MPTERYYFHPCFSALSFLLHYLNRKSVLGVVSKLIIADGIDLRKCRMTVFSVELCICFHINFFVSATLGRLTSQWFSALYLLIFTLKRASRCQCTLTKEECRLSVEENVETSCYWCLIGKRYRHSFKKRQALEVEYGY